MRFAKTRQSLLNITIYGDMSVRVVKQLMFFGLKSVFLSPVTDLSFCYLFNAP